MSLAIYTSAAWTANGGLKVADNATIEVRRESDGALATIYSDRAGTQAITNPSEFGDASGRFQFFAAGGAYRVKVTQDGEEHTLRYQAIGTAGEFDASAVSQAVDSVEDLRTSTFPASLERLWLSGYYGVGTAGGGPLYRDSEDTATADNGVTVFVDGDGVRWKRANKGYVDLYDAGVTESGAWDASDLSRFFNSGKPLRMPEIEIEFNGTVSLDADINLHIIGAGIGRTVLKTKSTHNMFDFNGGSIEISGVEFVGSDLDNDGDVANVSQIFAKGASFTDLDFLDCRHMKTSKSDGFIVIVSGLKSTDYVSLYDCYFVDNTRHCVYLTWPEAEGSLGIKSFVMDYCVVDGLLRTTPTDGYVRGIRIWETVAEPRCVTHVTNSVFKNIVNLTDEGDLFAVMLRGKVHHAYGNHFERIFHSADGATDECRAYEVRGVPGVAYFDNNVVRDVRSSQTGQSISLSRGGQATNNVIEIRSSEIDMSGVNGYAVRLRGSGVISGNIITNYPRAIWHQIRESDEHPSGNLFSIIENNSISCTALVDTWDDPGGAEGVITLSGLNPGEVTPVDSISINNNSFSYIPFGGIRVQLDRGNQAMNIKSLTMNGNSVVDSDFTFVHAIDDESVTGSKRIETMTLIGNNAKNYNRFVFGAEFIDAGAAGWNHGVGSDVSGLAFEDPVIFTLQKNNIINGSLAAESTHS